MPTRTPARHLPLSKTYLSELRAHITHTSAYHAGHDLPYESALSASVLFPGTCWTAREKNIFFRALSTQSRLRPDLIARAVGSKTLVDLLAFLDALEDGSQDMEAKKTDWPSLGQAIEVSDGWIKEEEKLAEAIIKAEAQRDTPAYTSTPSGEDDIESSSWPTSLSSLGTYQLQALDAIIRNQEDGNTAQNEDKAVEDDEEGMPSNEQPVPALTPPAHADRLGPPVSSEYPLIDPVLLSLNSSHRPSAFELSQPAWHPLPQLPSSFQLQSEPDRSSSSALHSQHFDELEFYPHATHPLPDISLAFAQDPISRLPMPPSAEQPLNGESIKQIGSEMENLENLSPQSWRRYQKRLYMRRKRASLRGEDVPTHVGRLKRGRKQKVGPSSAPSSPAPVSPVPSRKRKRSTDREDHDVSNDASSRVSGQEGETEDDDSEHESTRKRKKVNTPGQKGVPKALGAFAIAGVDANFLRAKGLDIFHYATLGRLSRDMVSDGSSEPKFNGAALATIAQRVRRYTERIVCAALVQAITHAEAKERARTWSSTLDVDAEDVQRAVRCVGMGVEVFSENEDEDEDKLDKEGDADNDAEDDDACGQDSMDEEDDMSSDSKTDSDDSDNSTSSTGELHIPAIFVHPFPPLELWHAINSPLLHLPAVADELERVLAEDEADIAEAWRMGDDEFEAAEEEEIAEEEDIDEEDATIFQVAEKALWAEVEKERLVDTVAHEQSAATRKNKNGNWKGRVGGGGAEVGAEEEEVGRIKSAEFIEDSE